LTQLFDLYAVLALVKGKNVTNEDVHNAWATWAITYDPENKSLVPFSRLSIEKQEEDTRFVIAIRNTVRQR
jgi:hypothetical protein